MRTLLVSLVLLLLAAFAGLALVRRSSRAFLADQRRRRHQKPVVHLPGPAPHGRRARKK